MSELSYLSGSSVKLRGDRKLVGHSYGGLFGAWNLISAPGLFQRYIIVSPSLWYADRWIFTLPVPKKLDARAYLAVGSLEGNEQDMANDLRRYAKLLKLKADVRDKSRTIRSFRARCRTDCGPSSTAAERADRIARSCNGGAH